IRAASASIGTPAASKSAKQLKSEQPDDAVEEPLPGRRGSGSSVADMAADASPGPATAHASPGAVGADVSPGGATARERSSAGDHMHQGHFTPQRERAIDVFGPPLDACVVAGPGSGKTTVLVEYFRKLVKRGTDPLRILAITFTERAAGNMRERLATAFQDDS